MDLIMKSEIDIFHKYLEKHDLRDTSKRKLMLDAFLKREEHISDEQLYDIVKKRDPSIGQATVYRVFKLLTEAKLAHEVDFGDGIIRYEHNYIHLIYKECATTTDIV